MKSCKIRRELAIRQTLNTPSDIAFILSFGCVMQGATKKNFTGGLEYFPKSALLNVCFISAKHDQSAFSVFLYQSRKGTSACFKTYSLIAANDMPITVNSVSIKLLTYITPNIYGSDP